MKKKVKRGILAGTAVILTLILIFALVCLTRINTHVWDYAYSPELPKPGIGVDFKHDDLIGNLFIRWSNLLNNIQTGLWKAPEQLIKQKLSIPARDGYKISGYLIEPEGHENDTLPVILYCHGGAFFLTMMPNQLDMASVLAKELQCRVFVPQYRTSLDAPYPIPLQDCYDVLQFIAADPRTDSEKILIYGDSAGGCLAASVTQLCCDERLLFPAGQMLIYPVTDTDQKYPDLDTYAYATWPQDANKRMWKTYLNGANPLSSDYAVPMLHESSAILPDAYVETAEMDILCDQGEAYGEKLQKAGVDVTMQKVPGAYHGYDGDVNNPYVRQMIDLRISWLRDALAGTADS